LEYQADQSAYGRQVFFMNLHAAYPHASFSGQETIQVQHKGAFSGPVRADQGNLLAPFDAE
jgi:hypothetical protein